MMLGILNNWKNMFNSAVCCTEPSLLLLLYQVGAFIGEKNAFVYNKSQASFSFSSSTYHLSVS